MPDPKCGSATMIFLISKIPFIWSSIRKAVKNGSYAYSSEDPYSRVFSLTHHIEKLEVCMHRDRWSSIGKAVKNRNYTNSG
jgi:hypothetical protein